MKFVLCVVGLLLLCSCSVPSESKMSWKDYYLARFALRVTDNRADVIGCEEVGSVSGQSKDDVGSAKEKAISDAVLLGADHLLFDKFVTDSYEREAYIVGSGNVISVYGVAYKCKE